MQSRAEKIYGKVADFYDTFSAVNLRFKSNEIRLVQTPGVHIANSANNLVEIKISASVVR